MIDSTASDWSDLDLLTIEEARGRLDEEIRVVRSELDELRLREDAAADGQAYAASIELRQRRLDALRETREHLPDPSAYVLE